MCDPIELGELIAHLKLPVGELKIAIEICKIGGIETIKEAISQDVIGQGKLWVLAKDIHNFNIAAVIADINNGMARSRISEFGY